MSDQKQDIDSARDSVRLVDVAAKLAAIRTAARHEYPTGDIDSMLAEIERGRWMKSR